MRSACVMTAYGRMSDAVTHLRIQEAGTVPDIMPGLFHGSCIDGFVVTDTAPLFPAHRPTLAAYTRQWGRSWRPALQAPSLPRRATRTARRRGARPHPSAPTRSFPAPPSAGTYGRSGTCSTPSA